MRGQLFFLVFLGAAILFSPETLQAEGLPDIAPERIGGLTIVQNGEEIFRSVNQPEVYKMDFDYWEILTPYQESGTVNTEAMYELYSTVLGLDFSSPAEVPEGTETGLESTGTYLEVLYVSDPAAMDVAEPDCAFTIFFGSAAAGGGCYAALEGSDAVYVLAEEEVEQVLGIEPFDYLLRIPVLMNIAYLERVNISAGGHTYSMEKDGDIYRLGGSPAEKEEFTALYQALMNIYLDSEIEVNQPRERQEVLRIVYHMKSPAPDAEVAYYTWEDGDYYAVEVDGREQFLTEAGEVDALIAQVTEIWAEM